MRKRNRMTENDFFEVRPYVVNTNFSFYLFAYPSESDQIVPAVDVTAINRLLVDTSHIAFFKVNLNQSLALKARVKKTNILSEIAMEIYQRQRVSAGFISKQPMNMQLNKQPSNYKTTLANVIMSVSAQRLV